MSWCTSMWCTPNRAKHQGARRKSARRMSPHTIRQGELEGVAVRTAGALGPRGAHRGSVTLALCCPIPILCVCCASLSFSTSVATTNVDTKDEQRETPPTTLEEPTPRFKPQRLPGPSREEKEEREIFESLRMSPKALTGVDPTG